MKEDTEDSSHLNTSNFMTSFLADHAPPTESISHFKSISWLQPLITSPKYKVIPTFSRHLKSSGEDYFFSRTINTTVTIPHMISIQLRDFNTPEPSNSPPPSSTSHKTPAIAPSHPDALTLLSLSSPGLNGHPSTLHGGVTCAILDETMGLLIMLHDNNTKADGKEERDSLYTANLNVTYRAPVPTPGEVLVKTWLVGRQGRKWYSKGQIVDREGVVLAEADGLWVTARRQKM
ncbi:hypothetical protein PMZ80_004676 [Knufia obscura]|uniref:Thioesterase domain-containing protein n=2 Tax=Knufia TaxID=430999 RepID=A0AAN8I3H7_9EURO|nr:hypothetical protein PMZ80_004676 [Knufia obscura]KAK5952667.1 hypothetical protein OHC33_006259 [Knufia fluminis]